MRLGLMEKCSRDLWYLDSVLEFVDTSASKKFDNDTAIQSVKLKTQQDMAG